MRNRELPSELDNSLQPYFRPIFSQDGGSCGQASGVGYNFTYEINFERGLSADDPDNQYPTHYTWNFLNLGVGYGSWYWDGWNIIGSNGCPTVATYGGMSAGGPSRWMSGYENYYSGMPNRIQETFSIDVSTPEGLETVKNWMYDHLEDDDVGGLVNFSAGVSGWVIENLAEGTPESGKNIIVSWDPSVNHAMTFIGYNDSIKFDYNQDGQFTNDVDINNDGQVDMKDWEIGGLMMANSWGESWGDEGKSYMMYRLLAELTDDGGIWGNTVHVMRAREFYIPYLTLKTTIRHTSRDKLKLMAGVSTDMNAVEPDLIHEFPLFNYQGGDFYMQGGTNDALQIIEIGLDITPLLSGIENGEPAKIFLAVANYDPNDVGEGEVISFSVIDHLAGGEEIICSEENIPIVNNSTTYLDLDRVINFQGIEITTDVIPEADPGVEYEYQLAAINGVPPYEWKLRFDYPEYELTGDFPDPAGTLLSPTNNDDGYAEVDLDFDFPFYTDHYDHLLVSTDGSILFGDTFQYVRSAENIKSTMAISPYCSDLMIYPEFGDGIWYSGDENSATFHWITSLFSQPGIDLEFQATLYPSGDIEFHYNGAVITPSTNWAAGVSRGDYYSYTIAGVSGSFEIPENYMTGFEKISYPEGMILTDSGLFTGIPEESNGNWSLNFRVTDQNYIFSDKVLSFSTSGTPAGDDLPASYKLGQNYPNPFNPTTSISFQLAEDSILEDVELKIYNIKGQKVKSFDSIQDDNDGFYSITWDGTDNNDQSVTSGVYFYRLEAGSYSEVKKMVLMK